MINSLTIRNFKSHRDIAMSDLGRINLILGKNNAGKTAILEALFLAQMQGSPKAAFEHLNHLRGIQPNDMVWDSVFHRFHAEEPVAIESVADGKKSILRIRAMRGNQIVQSSSGTLSGGGIGSRTDGLLFEYVGADGQKAEVPVTSKVRKGEAKKSREELNNAPADFVPSRSRFNPDDAAIRFGKLVALKRQQPLVDALKIIDTRLSKLESITTETGPELLAEIGEERMMPLTWMGDGMLRILGVVTSVVLSSNGIVLVDEIENGLHYSIMQKLWAAVFKAAIDQNVQVFAATHNDEMIAAALDAAKAMKAEDELRAFRVDLVNGSTEVVEYDAKLMAVARNSEQEIR